MTKHSGIVADGAENYIKALEERADATLRELKAALDAEPDAARREEISARMQGIRVELSKKRRGAIGSLF